MTKRVFHRDLYSVSLSTIVPFMTRTVIVFCMRMETGSVSGSRRKACDNYPFESIEMESSPCMTQMETKHVKEATPRRIL